MLNIIHFINKSFYLKKIIIIALSAMGATAGIDKNLIATSTHLAESKGVEFGAGLIVWLILFKLKVQVPRYNIYKLIPPGEPREKLLSLLKNKTENYRVAKQYHLLNGDKPDNELNKYISNILYKQLSKIPKDKNKNFNASHALECLCEITDILSKNAIDSFPISGTLLGLVRNGELLPHDYDVDIGVFSSQTSAMNLAKILRKENLYFSVYESDHLVTAKHKNGTVIDIFLHYNSKDGRVWHGSDIHRWYNSEFNLTRKKYCGREFLTPAPPEQYLDENYGDWSKKPLFWDYTFDTPNQEFPNTKKAKFFLLEKVLNETNKNKKCDRFTVEKALDALDKDFNIKVQK